VERSRTEVGGWVYTRLWLSTALGQDRGRQGRRLWCVSVGECALLVRYDMAQRVRCRSLTRIHGLSVELTLSGRSDEVVTERTAPNV